MKANLSHLEVDWEDIKKDFLKMRLKKKKPIQLPPKRRSPRLARLGIPINMCTLFSVIFVLGITFLFLNAPRLIGGPCPKSGRFTEMDSVYYERAGGAEVCIPFFNVWKSFLLSRCCMWAVSHVLRASTDMY